MMRGRERFGRYHGLLCVLAGFYGLFPLSFRTRLLNFHRHTRGYRGYAVRYALVKSSARSCGENVKIAQGVYLNNPQNLTIGNNVSINEMCYIECGPEKTGGISIGDNVSVAHGATIICTSHSYCDESTDIIKDMPVKTKPVQICSNVWIGAKSTILYGVTIATGCVIGANAVVTMDTEEDSIYAGVPAKKIKNRKCAKNEKV